SIFATVLVRTIAPKPGPPAACWRWRGFLAWVGARDLLCLRCDGRSLRGDGHLLCRLRWLGCGHRQVRRCLCHQFVCLGLILDGATKLALTCVGPTTIGVGACVARRQRNDLRVIVYGIVDITRQRIGERAVVVGGRILGSTLDDFRTALDPQLRFLTLKAVLLVVGKDRGGCPYNRDYG